MADHSQFRNPLTGEQIAEVTVGEPVRIDGMIELRESDPSWPGLFSREEARIRSILGARVRLLEHVGSTSVPGLVAKPIIDLVLAVADSADEGSYVPPLEAQGYVLRIREPDWFEHRVFKGPDTDINLHVFTEGAPEIDRMIAFRDRLRANPDDLNRCPGQTRAGGAGLGICPELRRRKVEGGGRDHRAGDTLTSSRSLIAARSPG